MSQAQSKIHLAVAAIIQGINAIAKTKEQKIGEGGGFKFRGIDDIYNEIHRLFSETGVVCVQNVESVTRETIEIEKSSRDGKYIQRLYRAFAYVGVTLTAPDGSSITGKGAGEGADHSDKATAKAITSAHKSWLIHTFLIPTAENDSDYEPVINAAGELRASEEDAKREVDAAAAGGQVQLSAEEQAKLDAKREGTKRVKGKVVDPAPTPTEHKEPAKTEPAKPAPAQTEAPVAGDEDWRNHVIAQISKSGIKGKKVSELTKEQLHFIHERWIKEYADAIEANPAKKIERDILLKAIAANADKATK